MNGFTKNNSLTKTDAFSERVQELHINKINI